MKQQATFTAGSPDIEDGARIPDDFAYPVPGGKGLNISPAIYWSGAPEGTKSYAVLVHDPDAPTGGSGWWHWLVGDIPPDVHSLAPGAGQPDADNVPSRIRQFTNDYGELGWGGPCPPVGDPAHRYNFTVYALDVEKLDLPAHPTAAAVGFTVNMHAIARAGFTGTYSR